QGPPPPPPPRRPRASRRASRHGVGRGSAGRPRGRDDGLPVQRGGDVLCYNAHIRGARAEGPPGGQSIRRAARHPRADAGLVPAAREGAARRPPRLPAG
ncbi:unnamed protein product, partial [Prorocentrum cordatum]